MEYIVKALEDCKSNISPVHLFQMGFEILAPKLKVVCFKIDTVLFE